jgi:transcriptional regulator of nitric oxide reductase
MRGSRAIIPSIDAEEARLKTVALALALVLGAGTLMLAGGQAADARLQARLKQLFPAATAFSPKGGDPPHYKAFGGTPNAQTLLGYAFWTTELMPLERGYDGPIVMLVGLDTKARLAGIIVTDHHEPYGSFSVDTAEFAAQFKGKDIRDAFKVGADIDAVSRATISITSATRAIKNSSRRIARQYLTAPGGPAATPAP